MDQDKLKDLVRLFRARRTCCPFDIEIIDGGGTYTSSCYSLKNAVTIDGAFENIFNIAFYWL
jgi:hypothetical protein